MKTHSRLKDLYKRKTIPAAIAACGLAASLIGPGLAELTDLSDVPLANSPSDAVLPNLMYILDDSGSMMWDYMPDNIHSGPGAGSGTKDNCKTVDNCSAGGCRVNIVDTTCRSGGDTADWGEPPYYSAQFNQIYYNPDVSYEPSVNSAGTSLGNSDPAAAKKDYYLDTTTVNLKTSYPEIYYCKSFSAAFTGSVTGTTLTVTAITSGTVFPGQLIDDTSGFPASTIVSAITGTGGVGTYTIDSTQSASPRTFTGTVSSPSATVLANSALCKRNGRDNIQASPNNYFSYWSNNLGTGTPQGGYPAGSSTGNAFINRFVRNTANPYYFTISPNEYCSDENLINCQLANSDGSAPSGFTLPAPVRYCSTKTAAASTLAISDSALSTSPQCRLQFRVTTHEYPRYGRFTRVDLTSSTTTYAKSATAVRPDCGGGATCTYDQELQNFANWYSYYRTRMAMMKTATARAFRNIDDRYRVGFITINPTASVDVVESGSSTTSVTTVLSASVAPSDVRFVPLATFDSTQKSTFYTTLFAQTNHGSTPLRQALSRVGRHYAGVTNGINTGMSTDPMTHSCQQNFALLTTDGYWNDGTSSSATTAGGSVGNQDNTPTGGTPVYVSRSTGTLDGTGVQQVTSTPIVETEQVLCSGNSWVFNWTTGSNSSGGNTIQCGCTSPQQKIMQRRREMTYNVTLLDGVQTSAQTNVNSVSFTTIAGCDAHVVTSTSQITQVTQAVCTGQTVTTFSGTNGGTNRSCGCGTSTDRRLITRTHDYTVTRTTVDGSASSTTVISNTFSTTACQPPAIQTVSRQWTETQEQLLNGSSVSTTFSTLLTGAPGGSQDTASCTTASKQRSAIQRVRLITQTDTVTDGVTTSSFTVNTTSFTSRPAGCTSTGLTAAASTLVVTTGPTVLSSNGFSILVTTLTPNPTTTSASSATVTGSTISAGSATLTPNPQSSSTAPSVTTTFVGTPETLADVAMYYYKTDLRTSGTLAPNNVPTSDKDVAPHQHMVTFSLGLGLRGLMTYRADYESAAAGDFAKIKSADTTCSWSSVSGQTCNWPSPSSSSPTTLDDLWHAAVNGRGIFYSAADPNSLADGLSGALSALKTQTAAASASATSSPNITETDNFIYSSTFRTVKWDGQITAQRIDTTTGNVLPTIVWEAQALLDAKVSTSTDTRSIWKFDGGVSAASNSLQAFTWTNMSAGSACGIAGEQACFTNKGSALSQYSTSLSSSQQTTANDGATLVRWLRGQSYNESGADGVYRDRDHVLGDSVNATPAYVRAPVFNFQDSVTPTYSVFKGAQAGRQGVLYIAGNDGMLHAFNGETTPSTVAPSAPGAAGGSELWAYIPRMVFPNLHKLATDSWDVAHKYYVDGSPQVMDVFQATSSGGTTGAWKTIMVGGLNKGGRGFYALDITDPNAPKGMWEICSDSTLCAISDADIGYSFGNAVITKRAYDSRWVVILTSGINNVTPGTGRGYLYVLDAFTGQILQKVDTGEGDATTPSGLSKISAYADNFNLNNQALYIYGGDLLGNLWRFDMSVDPPVAFKVAELKDGSNKPQSITSRPELGVVTDSGSNVHRAVFVGTGRYLGEDDLADPATLSLPWAYQQSFYAIKDKFNSSASAGHGSIRTSNPGLVQQTLIDNTTDRTTSTNAVDWGAKDGWYVDFNPGNTSPGERVNLDPQLVLGTIVLVTNVPNNNACTVGGDSFIYQFNYSQGTFVASAPGQVVATKFTGQITVGLVVVRLPSGVFKGVATGATGTKTPVGVNVGGAGGTGRRVSWRELVK